MKYKKTLFDLNVGDMAVVSGYATYSHETARLRALGLVEGEKVRIVRYAPLGDPIEIKVRGFYLSVDKATGETVLVHSQRSTMKDKKAA